MTQENDRPANDPETRRIPETNPETAATPAPENMPPAPASPPHAGETFASPTEEYPARLDQQEPGHKHAAPIDADQRDADGKDSADRDAAQGGPDQPYTASQDQAAPYQNTQYQNTPYQSEQYQPPAYQGPTAPGQQYPGAGYQYPAGYAAPGAGYGYQAPPAKTLSLISMVLGIISVATLGSTFFTQIAAVVLGHIALNKEPAGRGMALAGLIMGYVTIGLGILMVILAIIFFAAWAPYFSSTTSSAEFTV
ncbi:hypothetical protein GCM10023081_37530 [Arthrobacter ginkgonis]|uniref:DUF4190 domain-containing protein n=1 Tax=Arthrobacter ginkgonis TaxID=1630594 RepID=A0ABP7CZ14_9MICC